MRGGSLVRGLLIVAVVLLLVPVSARAAELPSDRDIVRKLVSPAQIRQTGYPYTLKVHQRACLSVAVGAETGRSCGIAFLPVVKGAYPYYAWITAFASQSLAAAHFAAVSRPVAGPGERISMLREDPTVVAYAIRMRDGSRPARVHVEVLLTTGTAGAECTWVGSSTVTQARKCAEQVGQRQAFGAIDLIGEGSR